MQKSSDSQLVYNNSIKSTNQIPINERILIPYYSLYSDRIVIHPKPFINITKRKPNAKSLSNLKKKKFTGNISKTQQSTIKKKLTAWLTSIEQKNSEPTNQHKRKEYYPVFITLTLSSKQQHSDTEIKRRLLDLLIKRLKKEFGVNKYFWRAESQKNGNIHFHLIVDKYCEWIKLKTIWNQAQETLGYISKFENKNKHRNPNSVDVKSAANIKNFVNYVLKYCLKDDKNRKIEGRVFGMSDELRSISIFQDVLDSELSDLLLRYEKSGYFTIYKQDYFTVLYFHKEFYKSSFFNSLQQYSKEYYLQLYENIYHPKALDNKIIKDFKTKLIKQESQLSMFKLSDQIKVINSYNYISKKRII